MSEEITEGAGGDGGGAADVADRYGTFTEDRAFGAVSLVGLQEGNPYFLPLLAYQSNAAITLIPL